jgi:anaerobic magnesium-protoporphyrin IX monomethyl ester cyclase
VPKINLKSQSFPLGAAYICSTIKKAGCSVVIYDQNLSQCPIKEFVEKYNPDICGITAMISQFEQVNALTKEVKSVKPDISVIVGGGLASAVPEFMLRESQVNICVVGEGEVTTRNLINGLKNGNDLGRIKGICFKYRDQIIKTPPQDTIFDINSDHYPDWGSFDINAYSRSGTFGFNPGIKTMDMITSRGCPYGCTYCFHGIFGHKFRARDADLVINEINMLREQYGINGFIFRDDTFVLDRNRVIRLCERLIDMNKAIFWACNGRVDRMDSEMLGLMKRAKCITIGYGIESGSQRMIDLMKRQMDIGQAKQIVWETSRLGIRPKVFLMMGMPGETEESLRDTVTFCKDTRVSAELFIATPIPGTALYSELASKGKVAGEGEIVKRWVDWSRTVVVNMTDLSDGKLLTLKRKCEKQIFLQYILNNYKELLRKAVLYQKRFGFLNMMARSLSWMISFYRTILGKD